MPASLTGRKDGPLAPLLHWTGALGVMSTPTRPATSSEQAAKVETLSFKAPRVPAFTSRELALAGLLDLAPLPLVSEAVQALRASTACYLAGE